MRVLIVAATETEIAPFAAMLEKFNPPAPYALEIIVTGVGIPATILKLSKHLSSNSYDLILNVGIAGAITESLSIPSLVWVVCDEFYEWGVENRDEFISVFDLGLIGNNDFPFCDGGVRSSDLPSFTKSSIIPELSGITVMRVHGNEDSIVRLRSYRPDAAVESMEGAAVMYTASSFSIPCLQLRAISNRVEPRNRASWKINESIELLNNQLMQWFILP